MSIKDNSIFPFLLLATLVYIIFYICLNSIFSKGQPYNPHENAVVFSKDDFNPIKSTIEETGNSNFSFPDSLLIKSNNQLAGWSKLRTNLSQNGVEILLGKPTSIFKGITELWYYENLQPGRGMVLFYKNKLVNWNAPGLSKRF